MRLRLSPAHLACSLSLGLLCACAGERVDSSSIRTSGMYADLECTADDAGRVTFWGQLRVGGRSSNTFVDLKGADQLAGLVGNQRVILEKRKSSLLSDIWYETTVREPSAAAGNVNCTIAFDRSGDTPAPDSTVKLPAVTVLSEPAENTNFSRANDDIVVSWTPFTSDRDTRITWKGSCIRTVEKVYPGNPRSVTLAAGTLVSDGGGTCEVTITVERNRDGSVDDAYGEGGRMVGRFVATVAVRSKP